MKKKIFIVLILIIVSGEAFCSEEGMNYFKGIVFGSGPMARKISVIEKSYSVESYMNISEIKDLDILLEQVFKLIQDRDPHYFNRVDEVMKSKNPVRISKEIDNMYSVGYEAVKDLYPESEHLVKIVSLQPNSTNALTVAAAVAVVVAAAVHNVAAVTSMAAVVVAVKFKLAVDNKDAIYRSDLFKEKLIRSIVIAE